MTQFTQVILYTDTDGHAKFRDVDIALNQGTPATRLSDLVPATGLQFRSSPVGFEKEVHCPAVAQWVFILAGTMEIGLADGTTRLFQPCSHFHSGDTLPVNATFDPKIHGHWSRQVGHDALVTLFVKGEAAPC